MARLPAANHLMPPTLPPKRQVWLLGLSESGSHVSNLGRLLLPS